MPRFFFHIRRGASLYADPEGQQLDDLHAAYTWAVRDARNLVTHEALEGDPALYSIEVCDAEGRVLSVVPVTGAGVA